MNSKKINWLPVNNGFEQRTSSMSLNFAKSLKLNQSMRKNNHGQKSMFYTAPIILNYLLYSPKTRENLISYKDRVNQHFSDRISNEANNIYSYY